MKKYFFCGICGSGMSALARLILARGDMVIGSDRGIDSGKNQKIASKLKEEGAFIYPQDGSGVNEEIFTFVVSGAVEDTIPDVIKAKKLGLTIKKRAELLSELFNGTNGIAIGGTSGKTTTTAMTGCILKEAGLSPTIINGGSIIGEESNFIKGDGSFYVIETDESDGSIELYNPMISVVTNISLDHKPLEELRPLFKDFVRRAKVGAIVNKDCEESISLINANDNVFDFSIEKGKNAKLTAENIRLLKDSTLFEVDGTNFELCMIGIHNIENALAAIGVADMLGIDRAVSAKALKEFKGVHRRMEKVGLSDNGIMVIDDFAHNPAKISASLSALKQTEGRIWAIYQPHGFAPTRLMKDDLIKVFSSLLEPNDRLILTEIFYAGGSVNKNICSADIATPLQKQGINVTVAESRADIISTLMNQAKPEDKIIIMGARDDTLSDFAKTVYYSVS